jgi:adenosylmethionine-8-amino-7-oxononanoate aminotransferase
VGEIRGQGLLLGVEFVADRATRAPFDLGGDHVLLAPPFIIDEEQVDLLAATLREGLDVAIAGLP